MILTEQRSPHQPGESDSPSPSPLWGWQRQLKVVVRQNKYLMQIEGDTSMITLNLSFLFSVFFFVPPPFFNRHNGKGSHNPSRQKSHGPACSDHRESEKQAQWPRRRHIQVQLLSQESDCGACYLWLPTHGGSISLKSFCMTTGYTLS